jgi:threonine dehydratase
VIEADLVSVADVLVAADRLAGVTVRTPLLAFGGRIWLKPESLQPTGAFKLRGAYNAIATLDDTVRTRGVVTHSSGNHAQGVARAASLLGVPATIVMPSDAETVKRARVEADGAEIVTVGPSSDERLERAHRLADERGLRLIPPYDDPDVIAGQGTVGLELVEDVAELDERDPAALVAAPALPPLTVLVPVGGGGLASGVALTVKALRPDARVIGVEPDLAADAQASMAAGRIVRWDPEQVGRTIADGMRTASIGELPFALLSRYLDGIVTVGETEIRRAMVRAADAARLVLEPSGATALAAWLFHAAELPAADDSGGRVVIILSGGNVDPERYARLMAEGRAAGG